MLLTQGIGDAVEQFADLDSAVTSAAAKFPESIKRGTAAFEELRTAARAVGAETQFTAAEAAEGLDFLAMAGFNAQQSIAALPALAELATAANMDLARSSDIASDALGAFGLMVDDPQQLATNLQRVNDVFAETVTTSNTTMETLFETMKESGPALTAAGANIETFAALTGKLGSAGIKGSKAGTTLKNMFLRLAAPVGKAADLMEELGVKTIDDTTGNMRDMIDILDDINKATADMGTGQRAAALDVIFSKRAISGASVLLDAGADSLRKYREQMDNARGSSSQMASEMRKSLTNQLKILKSTIAEKAIDITDRLLGGTDPAKVIGKIGDAIRGLDIQAAQDNLTAFGQTVQPIVTALGSTFVPVLESVKDLFSSISGLMRTMSDDSESNAGVIEFLADRWKAAFQIMVTSPIGTVIDGLTFMIDKIRVLIEFARIVGPRIKAAFEKVSPVFETIKNVIGLTLTPIRKMIDLLGKLASGIRGIAGKAINFLTGGALDQALATVAAQDQVGLISPDRFSGREGGAAAAEPAGQPVSELVTPEFLIDNQQSVDITINGLPQGVTATATSTGTGSPQVNTAQAG
jgi:TP901 family phage tail tape measure protein